MRQINRSHYTGYIMMMTGNKLRALNLGPGVAVRWEKDMANWLITTP
jgi:hypothetical protein